ncbi:MAG: PPC domain-containing protein [Chloroflexi bacterium]|nr:PPC domain-containing protein [Chloroflexota bacterium]
MRNTRFGLLLLGLVLLLALPLMAIQAQTPVPTPTPRPTSTAVAIDPDARDEDTPVLEYGDSVDGELTLDEPTFLYQFEGEAGDAVTITMVSEAFDTYLSLQDDSGFELTYDDDSAGNLDSRISAYELPYSGTYYIEALSFGYRVGGSSGTGDYTLSLNLTEVRNIEYTQEVEGELSASEPNAIFRFNGDSGDMIAVTVEADGFSPYVYISDDTGYNIAYSDYYNSSSVASVGPVTLAYDGTYTIIVQTSGGTPSGSFILVVDEIELTAVEFGEETEVELSGGLPAYFSFEASAGELVNVSVDSDGTIDTRLDILDPSGYNIYSDDDSGTGFDPEVNRLVISQTGTYTIVLRAFATSGEGTVVMTVDLAPVPSLDDGPQVLELGDKQQRGVVTFEAEAGEQYTVRFDGMSGAQPYITFSQDGFTITTISSGPVDALEVTITATGDGPVQIQVEDYSYTNIAIEIALVED